MISAPRVQAHGKTHSADDTLEVLYREGLRLNFVCDDDMRYSITEHADPQHTHQGPESAPWVDRHCLASMVRRHLLQQAPLVTPTDDELRTHLRRHSELFESPQRYDFEQRYFRDQRPGRTQIDALNTGVPVKSVPHPVGESFRQLDLAGIQQRFGLKFAAVIQHQAVGVWDGPVRSALGWHLLRVNQHHEPKMPGFQQLRSRLLEHWQRQQREQWLESRIEALVVNH